MSILINGIEMPISCRACRFAGLGGIRSEFNVCMFTGESQPKLISERMSRCPLVPVPKHGALIDRDELKEHKYTTIPSYRKEYADGKHKSDEEIISFKFGWNEAINAIVENAPIIIPASEEAEVALKGETQNV